MFDTEIDQIKKTLSEEDLYINKADQPLHYAHYLVNKALNPNKDRQSLRAAIFSGDNEEPVNLQDLAEVLGFKVRPVSDRHIIDLIEGPDMANWKAKDVFDYISTRLNGKPGLTIKKIKTWQTEGEVTKRALSYIHRKLK